MGHLIIGFIIIIAFVATSIVRFFILLAVSFEVTSATIVFLILVDL